LKSSTLDIWLLGYEFPETIIVFMHKQIHVLCNQQKAKLTALAGPASTNYPYNLALCVLGSGYDRTVQKISRGYTHVLVAIDKFTKWIEYKPIASLTSSKAVEFIQEIIFRFGYPTVSSRAWDLTSQAQNSSVSTNKGAS
jgi:hypothetical protein